MSGGGPPQKARRRILSLLLGAYLLATPVLARPPRHNHNHPKQHPVQQQARHSKVHRARRGGVDATSSVGITLAHLPPGVDRQKLVAEGRLAPFYDPKDLSKPPVLSAPSAILIDADTGQTLWGKNPNARHYPASTTKILTSLIFIEHTRPEDIVTCLDPNITKIEPSSLNIKPWEKFSAQDLVYGTLLRSGNDGAVLMAEYVAGSVRKFADVMNARAQKIGATNSHFVTPNGLHDPAHFTTVRDMGLIACEAMRNPRFADAVSQPERLISRSVQVHDSLIVAKAKNFWLTFPGADGVKTGYTHQAGHCFVGSATREGRRLIAVAFESKNSAVKDTIPILAWGFERFPAIVFAKPGTSGPSVTVRGGARPDVPTVAAVNGLHASYDALKPETRSELTLSVESANVAAPVTKGEVVGQMTVRLNSAPIASMPLTAVANVAQHSPLGFLGGGGTGESRGSYAVRIVKGAASACGGLAVLLVAWRWYGATSTKSARRRRRRLEAARRGADRVGQGPG